MPRASTTAAAAIAFWRLWAPRSRISSWRDEPLAVPPEGAVAVGKRGRRGPCRTARARPGPPTSAARSTGATATVPGGWRANTCELGGLVGVERPVAVEVVLGEVEQHAGVGGEEQRVLELERRHLGDHDRRLRQAGAEERGQRGADVARHHHRQARGAVQVADQLDRRRLPVRAGDDDRLVRHQPPAQLELAQHADPGLAGGGDDRRLRGHPRALDHGLDAPRAAPCPACRRGPAPRRASNSARRSSETGPESTPTTSAPSDRSAIAAATPDRARPTTRYGPGGSGGRGSTGRLCRAVRRLPRRPPPGAAGPPGRRGRPRTRGPRTRGGGGPPPGRPARCRRCCRRS